MIGDRSSPSTRTVPAVGDSSPTMQRIVVVSPAPLGPRKPNTSPASTRRSSPWIPTVAPYRLVSAVSSITAAIVGSS